MVNNDPHNRKQPFILGMIALVSGILLALFILDKVHAGDRQDLLTGAPFLISSDIDNTIYSYRVGSNVIMPLRIGFGYITPNLNDNNNAAVTFLDEFTIDYTTTNSWSDKQSVYRKGFAYDNFGIVYGELFAPNTGGITEWTTESFHVSKNQYVGVISAPPCHSHRMQDGYYQIYFRDVDIDLPESVDLGRGRYFCISIPQEHYDEFVLTTNSFVYPYLDYYVSYYDFTLNQWIGLLPRERFHELLEGYVLAYADRSIKISCNNSYVYVKASQFQVNIPTSTPSPTPTPDPNTETYHILLNHVNGVYNHTSYMVSFKASGILNEYNQPLNSTVESVLLESETESTILKYNASIKKTGGYSGSWIGQYYGTGYIFYVKCSSFSDLRLYRNSSVFASENFSYIENNYSYIDLTEGNLQNEGDGYNVYYYVSEVEDGYIIAFSFKTGEYGDVNQFNQSSDIWFQEGNINSNSNTNYFVPFENNSDQYKLALNLMLDVNNNAVPDPNVTPTPDPTASPTPPPYVIIITPDPSPSPTPPFVIPTMPPWNPPGNQIIPLNPDIQNNVFGDFKVRLGDNNAFGLIGLLVGLLPGDLMWYLWFLLFVLLVVGVSKLIIHFTGG